MWSQDEECIQIYAETVIVQTQFDWKGGVVEW